jgi:hypothetical protein
MVPTKPSIQFSIFHPEGACACAPITNMPSDRTDAIVGQQTQVQSMKQVQMSRHLDKDRQAKAVSNLSP